MFRGCFPKKKKQTKKSFQKKARERYQNLSEKENDKKCQYAPERYKNLSEEENEKKRQYGREPNNKFQEDKKQR